MRYLLRRLASGLLLLFAISLLSFAMAELAPGDFLAEIELNPRISEETVAALRQRYGLDESLPQRYLGWLGSVLSGDFGYSFLHARPVGEILLPRARNTLLLSVSATALAWLVALPWGAAMAARPGGLADRAGAAVNSVLLAVPPLLLALLGLFLAASSGFLPSGGMRSLDHEELSFAGRLADLARHLLVPVTALVLGSLSVLLRHVQQAVRDALEAPFLHAARGHGIAPGRLLFAHALPAAAPPLVALFGFSIASLLSASLVVEVVMGWPGIGTLLIEAILARDLHVVVGVTLLSAVFVFTGQWLADLLLRWLDPRTAAHDVGGASAESGAT